MQHTVQFVDNNIATRDYSHIKKNHLLVTSVFYTVQGEGPHGGIPAVFIRLAGCNRGIKRDCWFCFYEGQHINTPKGRREIRDIQVGDELFALDKEGKLVYTTVKRRLVKDVSREDMVVVEYQLPDSTTSKRLYCTKDHPFHTVKRGFVPAGELRTTDKIYHVSGYTMVSENKKNSNPMFSESTREKVSKSFRRSFENGDIIPYTRTKKIRALLSLSKLGDRNPMKRHAVRLKNALSHNYKKSKLEGTLHRVLKRLGFDILYTGNNGKAVVGDVRRGFHLPDFKFRGKKKVIECYDKTFSKYKEGFRTRSNYEKPLRSFYKKFGFDVLFLTNSDLPNTGSGNPRTIDAFQPLKEKVGMFQRNGASILAIRPWSDREYANRCRKDGAIRVVNFSCAPYNTFVAGNLHTHNCDTNFLFAEGTQRSYTDLLEEIGKRQVRPSLDKPLIVITGGEPLLQETNLAPFVHELCVNGYQVQVETNGDLLRLNSLPRALIVMSPKASMRAKRYTKPHREALERADYLKFLLEAKEGPYHDVADYATDFADRKGSYRVFLSPISEYARDIVPGETASMWTGLYDRDIARINHSYAARYAMKYGYRLSMQQHLYCTVE